MCCKNDKRYNFANHDINSLNSITIKISPFKNNFSFFPTFIFGTFLLVFGHEAKFIAFFLSCFTTNLKNPEMPQWDFLSEAIY